MHRRTFLAGAGTAAGTASFARPTIAQPAASRMLRYVPQADLADLVQSVKPVFRDVRKEA